MHSAKILPSSLHEMMRGLLSGHNVDISQARLANAAYCIIATLQPPNPLRASERIDIGRDGMMSGLFGSQKRRANNPYV